MVTHGATSCNCDKWDKSGCEDTDGTGNAVDGTACSETTPPGGAPRALRSDPPILRIKDVGIAGSMTTAPGQSFDLIVSNTTDYYPWTYQWTYQSGEFMQININGPRNEGDPPTSTTFEICAVPSRTSYEDFLAGEKLVLDEFPLTFYDLCAPAPARWAHEHSE